VNWGNANANASVRAFTLNSLSCSSDTVRLPVRINQLLTTVKPSGPASVCQADGPFTYQTPYTNGSVYAWEIVGGTQVSTNQGSVQVRWTQVGIGKIVVTETSEPSSTIRCFGRADTLYVNVLPSPLATLAINGPARVCAGSGTVNFSLPGAATSTYQFTLNGAPLASTTAAATFATPAAGTYTLTARETNISGCAGPVYTRQFTVDPLPAAVAINGPRNVCPENLNGLRYSVTGLAGSTFQWTVNGGTLVSGQGTNNVVINFANGATAKTLSVTETSSFGCNGAANTLTVSPDNVSLSLQVASVDQQDDRKINLNLGAISNTGNGNRITILRREAGNTGSYQSLGTVANTASTFADANVDADARSYQYLLQLTNSCGTVLSSTEHTTVRLEATATQSRGGRDEGKVTLRWNSYLGLSITQYAIYRRLDSGAEELVQIIPATSATQYTTELVTGAQGFNQCFRIRAVSSLSNLAPSLSNEACVSFENPLAFYNIITPNGDGLNDVVYIDNVQLYPGNTFTIFNRWGKEIYATTNYRNTWGGEGASSGVYYYLFKLPDGTKRKGWFEIVK
ncbi:MAG TPA: gliding motility-associated C-terminal domain-containing protein, partial [Hymenobacter sp.]